MTDRTYGTLADAIQAHAQEIQGSDDCILTDWVVYAYSTSMAQAHAGVYQRVSSSMPAHTLMGLIDRLQREAADEPDDSGDDEV